MWAGPSSGETHALEFVYRHGSVVRFVDSIARLKVLDESGTLVMDAAVHQVDGAWQLGNTGQVRDATGQMVSFHRRPWWSE